MKTKNYLADYRVCRPAISGNNLTVYTAENWLDMVRYTYADIISDLGERGVSEADLKTIENHAMVMNDGIVILTDQNSTTDKAEQAACLERVRQALSL